MVYVCSECGMRLDGDEEAFNHIMDEHPEDVPSEEKLIKFFEEKIVEE